MTASLAQAALQIGQAFGIPQPTPISVWSYSTVSEATPSQDATETAEGTRSPLYIVPEKISFQTQSLPAYPVGSTRYKLLAAAGMDIAVGGILRSGAYAFVIATLDTDQGWVEGIVEKEQGS